MQDSVEWFSKLKFKCTVQVEHNSTIQREEHKITHAHTRSHAFLHIYIHACTHTYTQTFLLNL